VGSGVAVEAGISRGSASLERSQAGYLRSTGASGAGARARARVGVGRDGGSYIINNNAHH